VELEKSSGLAENVELEKNSELTKNGELEKNSELATNGELEKNSELTKNGELEKNSELDKNSDLEKNSELTKNAELEKNSELEGKLELTEEIKQVEPEPEFHEEEIEEEDLEEDSEDEPEEEVHLEEKTPQLEFIDWLKSVGISVQNITTDFQDGKNLCKLVNVLGPGLIGPEYITDDALANAFLAITIAHKKIGIPPFSRCL